MNLVLVVYAFMAAFLVVFQHRLDNGTFGRGASRAVDSGTILVNPTDAVAIYSPRCHGARARSLEIEQMPLTTTVIAFMCLLLLYLSAIVTDGVLAILSAREPPYWVRGPYNVACLGLRWLGGIFSSLGNALPPFTKFCHGLVKNTLRCFGIFFYGLGNGLCDVLVHIQLRYDAQVLQMLADQEYFKIEIITRDQTINARNATIAADRHHHQSALMARDFKGTQRDQLLTEAGKEKNEFLAESSRKDTELANEKARSRDHRAEIRILKRKFDVQSGKMPFGLDTLKTLSAQDMPDGDKMALELGLYKKETGRLQREVKHAELAGACYKRMVHTVSDLKSERDQQQTESGILRGDLKVERAKNVRLEKYVVELEKAVEDGVDRVSNLCQQQDELREEFGVLQDQNVNQQCDLLHAQGIINDTLDKNEKLQDLADDRLKQLGLAESTNARLQVEIDGAENAKAELGGQLNGATKTNTLLQGKVLSIQGQLSNVSETKTQLEGKVLDIQGQFDGTLKTKTELEGKVFNIQGQLDSTLKTKTELDSKVFDIQGQLKNATKTKAQLESKLNDTQGKSNAAKIQLLTQVHNVEAKLDGALKTNAKLLRQSEKDEKSISKLKSALRKASLKNARLQKKTIKGRIFGLRKSTKASKENRDDDWKDEGPDSGDDNDGDDDNNGNPAPPSTPPPSTAPLPTPPPSTPPPSTSPPAKDATPSSAGKSINDESLGVKEESYKKDHASTVSIDSSDIFSPSPAQDATPSYAGKSMNDESLGVKEEGRKKDDASTMPIDSSDIPSLSLVQNATPENNGSSEAKIESREINGASNVPIDSSDIPSLSLVQNATPENNGSPEAKIESREIKGASNVPIDSSDIPSPSPIQDATPENDGSSEAKIESPELDGASNVPVDSSTNPSSPPAQDATLLSAGKSTNDGSSGATVEGREVNGASDLPVVSPEDPSPSPARDAPPLSVGNSMSDEGIGLTIGRRQGDIDSTVPVDPSSPATNAATPKTENSQSNDTPEPIIPLASTAAERIDKPNPVANSAPSAGNIETSEADDDPKSTTPPPSNKAKQFSNDHKVTTSPSTGNSEISQTNDTSKLTTPLPMVRDQGLFDIKPVTDSAPSARTVRQASPINAALVPLPESPAALPANLVRSQVSEEALQASYAQHGLPDIDDEGLGEGEREDLAREKLDWEDEEQEFHQGAMDTSDDNLWRNEEEDVDMENSDGNPPFEPAKPDDANQQAPALPFNLGSKTCPTATHDLDYLFEEDGMSVDMDNEIFYGSNTTKSHEGTPAAGNDSASKPEVNVEMGEAGPPASNPKFSDTQGNAGPVATPQQAHFIPPSQPVAPTSAPASTSPEFGIMSPYSGFSFPAVPAVAGGEDPAPASSTSSPMNPGSMPASRPSIAPLYCPTPAFYTPSRNAPRTSSSTRQPATPFGRQLTPEELRRGPSAFQAFPRPSELPRLNPKTTPTAPSSGSFSGAMARSINPPTTPSRPRSSSSSSSESESEQPTATGWTSAAGPSAPPTSAMPNGRSAYMALPGLGQDTPCDFTTEIGTPIGRRAIARPRKRRSLFPTSAPNPDLNYRTIIDGDGNKVLIPEDDDEFAERVENDLVREAEALEPQPPTPPAPNTSSLLDLSHISDDVFAEVDEFLREVDQDIKAKERVQTPVEADRRLQQDEHMAEPAPAPAPRKARKRHLRKGSDDTEVRKMANTAAKRRRF